MTALLERHAVNSGDMNPVIPDPEHDRLEGGDLESSLETETAEDELDGDEGLDNDPSLILLPEDAVLDEELRAIEDDEPADKATSYVNRGTFEEVVLPLFDRLYRHARHRANTVEQAEDLLQNALVKAHEKWDSYEQGTYALAWVKKIMDNIHLNTVSRGAAKREVTSGDIDPDLLEMDGAIRNAPLGRPDLEVIEAISHQEILDLFNMLSDDRREVLERTLLREMSYEDTAEDLGIPIGTVMSRLYRGRRDMQDLILEHLGRKGMDQ